jgi:uroporphyrinogen III methyltransferase/synthase
MIRIGTRRSRLAMVQTELVKTKILEAFPAEKVEIVPITTKGDIELDKSLAAFGGKGVFTAEIEQQLISGDIDIAVHSAKDIPMEFADGLCLGAVLPREDCRDVLITLSGVCARDLKEGSVIGTSSLRRQLQIKRLNPYVKIKVLRGNVPTRIEKLRNGEYDGIILAAAGLKRLGLSEEPDLHYEYFDETEFLPAAGQGIIALEIRKNTFSDVMSALNDEAADIELTAERAFLQTLDGSCNAPCGVCCKRDENGYVFYGMYARDINSPRYDKTKILSFDKEEAKKAAILTAKNLKKGFVSLVGAGPGDFSAISIRGIDCVRRADVLVYDNLISPSLLNEARLDAELVYVGKRADVHAMEQEEINRTLVDYALQGKYVVRLKGGDPFIFGRGGEEVSALKENGIKCEVVCGISSSYSVPSYAGIPVTHRGISSSFHVITGHEKSGSDGSGVDYEALAQEKGTLIFLMGLGRLQQIADSLMSFGKDKVTPAAVIENGTTSRQKIVTGTLNDISDRVKTAGLKTPAIIIVGDVVSLRDSLYPQMTEKLALSGKRILLTGTRRFNKPLKEELLKLGSEPVNISLVETESAADEASEKISENIEDYKWITFASAAGIEAFFALLDKSGVDRRKLSNVKFAVVGSSTELELKKYGYSADLIPSRYCSEELAKELLNVIKQDDKVLVVRGVTGSDILQNELKKNDIKTDIAVLYNTVSDMRRKDEINRIIKDIDYVVIASGSAGKAFKEMLEPEKSDLTDGKIVVIGAQTEKICRQAGLCVDYVAKTATAHGIAELLCSIK